MNFSRRIAAAVIMTVAVLHSAAALSLEPLSHTFGVTAEERVRTFQVTNTQDQRISVRIRMLGRDLLPDGRELREEAADDWLVFPRQMTLEPGTTQAVRVQYRGNGEIQTELAYRIIAEQLPVDFSGGQRSSGINVLFRYEGSVYVAPPGARPELVLTTAETQRDNETGQVLVRFENRGTAHGILNDLSLELELRNTDGEVLDELTVSEEELPVLGGANLLAGRSLEERVDLPPSWSAGTIHVAYTVDLLQ